MFGLEVPVIRWLSQVDAYERQQIERHAAVAHVTGLEILPLRLKLVLFGGKVRLVFYSPISALITTAARWPLHRAH